MPYDGLKRFIAAKVGSFEIRTATDSRMLASSVANHYGVSLAAARRRIEKDLAIVPVDGNPNRDLFA